MRKTNKQLENKGEQSNPTADANATSFICSYCNKYVEKDIGCDKCDY